MLAQVLSLAFLTVVQDPTFHRFGPYDAAVPAPESVLGYGPGERHTDYWNQERYLQALVAGAPGRVKRFDFGKSTEGRPLRILVFASPERLNNLEALKENLQAVAHAKATPQQMANLPAVVWINETIHGNEPASFESGMWLAYTLAASQSPQITGLFKDAVVILNPSYNPDGHERYVFWYNSIATGSTYPDAFEHSEPDVVYGRTNHYRFDMNRDRVAMSQVETIQEVAEFLRWNPHVYVDQHGQVASYFFPPVQQSVNANVDRKRYEEWTSIFGKATGAAFDKQGFTYYIRDWFDFYAPVYLDTWATLSGAIGMTHETDGPRGRAMERSDGSVTTLKTAMAKHFTSALAVIGSAGANREKLVKSYAEFKRRAVSGQHAGKVKAVVASGSYEQLERLQEQLQRSGIESTIAESHIELKKAHSLWNRGDQNVEIAAFEALIVPMAQPQGVLAKTIFESMSDFEPEFVAEQLKKRKLATSDEQYPGAEPYEFYDLTAWNLLFAHGLDGWTVDALPSIGKSEAYEASPTNASTTIGWAIEPGEDAGLLALRLLQKGIRIQTIGKTMTLDGRTLSAGSLLILLNRNEIPNLEAALFPEVGTEELIPLTTSYPSEGRYGPGSESVYSLKKPFVGVIFGDGERTTDFGSVWYLMEQVWRMPFVPLHKDALEGDLSRFSCLVFPAGSYGEPSAELKKWIERGGCAVVLGGRWPIGEKALFKLDQVKLEKDKLPGEIPGSIFLAELDPRSFLSYGYERKGDAKIPLAVPVGGDRWYKAKPEGGGAVTFSSDPKLTKLLSGWVWPDDTEKNLGGVVWLHDEPMGRGHVIWFAEDPTQRAMWPGLNRLLLNAILYGPAG